MPQMNIVLNGEGKFSYLAEGEVIHLTNEITVTALPNGMKSGNPSVAFIFTLPDGKKVFAETSMKLFQAVYDAFVAHYGKLEY